jgi:hypothetical protein
MANNITPKLKAFVRIDGTGRVIPGAPIFQAQKPKVGNWREVPLYYRGDSTSSTTTSTTTASPTTTTTTTATPSYSNAGAYNSNDPAAACSSWLGGGSQAYYSSVQTPTIGTLLFENSNLTGPIANGYVAMIGKVFVTLNGAISSEYSTCPDTTTTTTTTSLPVFTVANQRWGNTSGDACGNVNPATTFYTTGPLQFGNYLQDGNVIYLDEALTQPVQYPYIVSPGIGRLLDCANGVLSNQRNC